MNKAAPLPAKHLLAVRLEIVMQHQKHTVDLPPLINPQNLEGLGKGTPVVVLLLLLRRAR
jgi:hypothetical protein